MLLQKKEKEKLQLCVSMGRNSLQQKTLPILQTKNLLRKIKNGGDIHERTDIRITSTETVFLAKELNQQRDPPKVGNFPVSTRLLQKSTGEEEEAANLEKQ
jgi:hypothetical protein